MDARFPECGVLWLFPFYDPGALTMRESLLTALKKLRLSGLSQTLELRLAVSLRQACMNLGA